MIETCVFGFWWLIPLLMIVLMLLCMFGARGCCAGWRRRVEQGPEAGRGEHDDTALAILSRRYARGEIDDEEYTRKRTALNEAGKGARK